jgi:hypothetical protein
VVAVVLVLVVWWFGGSNGIRAVLGCINTVFKCDGDRTVCVFEGYWMMSVSQLLQH